MKEFALVIIKPDGMSKGLVGSILAKFAQPNLDVVGMRIVKPTRSLAEKHYQHIKGKSFFKETVDYFLGKYHKEKRLLAVVYFGEDAIRRCRKIAGATNPEEANSNTIRGSFGRITTDGIYENVVHVSSNKHEAKREIRLWFKPQDIVVKSSPAKLITNDIRKRIWA